MKSILCVWILIVSAPHEGAAQGEITVSAAISLKNAFQELSTVFENRSGTKVNLNLGASGDLMHQIKAGAPVDVFASASTTEAEELGKAGKIDTGSVAIFAGNSVVLVVPKGKHDSLMTFQDLARKQVTKIALGNPRSVPAGRYSMQVLAFYGVVPAIEDKFVLAENVRQVLDYVAREEVDAGIVYATDASTAASRIDVVATAPAASHEPVRYPIAIVSGTLNRNEARAFLGLVLSQEGKAILMKYGFTVEK